MLLAIDIGNTNITFGIFDGNELIKKFNMPSNIVVSEGLINNIKKHLEGIKLSGCIVASVVIGADKKIKKIIDREYALNTVILSTKSKVNLKVKLDNPDELGADRIANALGALEMFEGKNVIVVDFGTATTFDVVTKNREFIGGLITTGLHMQLNSLYAKTSKLPKIELYPPKHAVATNTKDAILSGIVLGNACMIDGMIKRYKEELAPEKYIVVATGGFASFIEGYMKESFDYIAPELTLIGLNSAYKKVGVACN